MCKNGHSEEYRSGRQCLKCHSLSVYRTRHGMKIPRYILNVEKFKLVCKRGRRSIVFELAGISSDSYGRYLGGQALMDAERRNNLAKILKVPHDELWMIR